MPHLDLRRLKSYLESPHSEGLKGLKDLPAPKELSGVSRATSRIVKAVENREKILLIGDYDVDGVVSTSIMLKFFKALAFDISYMVPNRFRDGYGVSVDILKRYQEIDLVITVDNGISAFEAAEYCKNNSIDLILTDHHEPQASLPDAYVVIDQKQKGCSFPYREICGAQVAWYLIASLRAQLLPSFDIRALLPFVSLAIVADVMPITDINWTMLKEGMRMINNKNAPLPFEYFKNSLYNDKLYADDFAFGLAPMINAAGRVKDSQPALAFLLSESQDEVKRYFDELSLLNSNRKEIEAQIYQEAVCDIDKEQKLLILASEGWHEGVLGIVASRVANRYNRPTIVLTKNEQGFYKGSGRSYGGFNLFRFLKDAPIDYVGFGGHAQAVGLSLDEDMLGLLKRHIADCDTKSYYEAEEFASEIFEIEFLELNRELELVLEHYSPFGNANPKPLFKSYNLKVVSVRQIGANKEHALFYLEQNGLTYKALCFNYIYQKNDYFKYILFEVDFKYRGGRGGAELLIKEAQIA